MGWLDCVLDEVAMREMWYCESNLAIRAVLKTTAI